MQDEISPKEFSEWIAFNKICPIGRERFDYLAALVSYSIAASAGSKVELEDLIPDFDSEYNEPAKQKIRNDKMRKKATMSARIVNMNFLREERKRLNIR